MTKSMGVAELKKHFSEIMSEISLKGEHFIIERKGKPVAVMVSIEDFDTIKRRGKKEEKKGLLAAVGAWEDFYGLDRVIEDIYKKRRISRDRSVERLK